MFSYYLEPQPQHIEWMLLVVSQDKLLENRDAVPPIQGFLAEVFIAEPDQVKHWAEMIAQLPAFDQLHLWLPVWLSSNPEGRAVMKEQLETRSEFFKSLMPLLEQEPPAPQDLPITSSAVLDFFWGAYFASGDDRYLFRISIVLAWDPEELAAMQDTRRQNLRAAAAWSLRSNARDHASVLAWCEQEINDAKGPRALEFQEIIAQARSAPQVTTP